MDKGITKIIDNYIQFLIEEQIIFKKAYLFGSYTKSTETKDSDIDIALVFDKENMTDRFDLQVQLLTLASYIDTRIEPHPIDFDEFNNENPFAREIIKTGKEIEINFPVKTVANKVVKSVSGGIVKSK